MTTTPPDKPDPDDVAAVRFAQFALTSLRQHNTAATINALNELHRLYQWRGVYIAMFTWADILTAADPAAGKPVGFAIHNVRDGNRQDVNDSPHWARWAARFIAARAQDDTTQCIALINAITSPAEMTACFNGLLHVVAQTLEQWESGEPTRVPIPLPPQSPQ